MSSYKVISPITLRHPALQTGLLKLPNEPVISVSLRKTIITTPVAGRDFGVIEIISAQNYQVTIEGVSDPIETEEDSLDTETLRKLNNLARINASLEVENSVLETYGIRKIVVESFTSSLTEYAGQIKYRFDCLSDDPTELLLLRESSII